MTEKKRRLYGVNSRDDAAPNVIRGKIRDGEIVGVERLGRGELVTQERGKLFLDLYGRTKDYHNVKLTLVITYEPDLQKILKAASSKEIFAQKAQMELSHRLQATCKFLLEKYTKEELKQKSDDVAEEAYSKMEYAINELEGLHEIDHYADLKFLKKPDGSKNNLEAFLENGVSEALECTSKNKEQILKKLSNEYASWYVANHPDYSEKINFWQPVYAKAFELYFSRIEDNPALKQKKFEEIVSKKEIERIIENSYRGALE